MRNYYLNIWQTTIILLAGYLLSNADGQIQSSKIDSFRITEITEPVWPGIMSPIAENEYRMFPSFVVEYAPYMGVFVIAAQEDSATGTINNSIMDGEAEVIGFDFTDKFIQEKPNPIQSFECLEFLGKDSATGRFILRLTVGVTTTGDSPQWDSLVFDFQDPLDVDGDGITGKGPDGIYGTDDDTVETDGYLDTGDGVLDTVFPLDPTGLTFEVTVPDSDDKTATGYATGLAFFLGFNSGGPPIQFSPEAGPVTVISAIFELRDANGAIADFTGNGIADGQFDITSWCAFNNPVTNGWNGSLGLAIAHDGFICTTHEFVNGNIRTLQLITTYLSDVVPKQFCYKPYGSGGPCDFELGDINNDGVIDLLDVNPLVNLILDNELNCEADINEDGSVDLLDVEPFITLLLG